MAAVGHEDPFPRPGPNGRCRFGQQTFAGVRGNGRDAPIAAVCPTAMKWRGPDPQETFSATPADRRVGQEAIIRLRLLDMPTARSRQLIEQPRRFFQIGSIEALGEPAIDRCQQITCLRPPALLAPQPSEARRGTQF